MKKIGFLFLCIMFFIISLVLGAIFKLTYKSPDMKRFEVSWSEKIGIKVEDLTYGSQPANRFDLYLPADHTRENYGLVVYIHAGGFTSGDKKDDTSMLEWLCSLGYVSCGINYTLFSESNPDANIYTQSMEIKESIPYVIKEAKDRGYHIDKMAIGGGSAGGCLASLYAYRDANHSPVPVKMVFQGVGPTSFYPEDWKCYGFDKNEDAAAKLFSQMTGKAIQPEMFGTLEYDELVKDATALYWINENSVPTIMAYGTYDKFQPFDASKRLDQKLTKYGIDHQYYILPHSGHGLQNDNKIYIQYMDSIVEYLGKYMPINS
ncbi:MAG: alpha/beta hydrolase [Prevotella sp.]|nr:alpha/beta hydrolase [Staphylococcus sp.]MCM1349852.1 alpha/beta hydrolase [Prevotella sp.]